MIHIHDADAVPQRRPRRVVQRRAPILQRREPVQQLPPTRAVCQEIDARIRQPERRRHIVPTVAAKRPCERRRELIAVRVHHQIAIIARLIVVNPLRERLIVIVVRAAGVRVRPGGDPHQFIDLVARGVGVEAQEVECAQGFHRVGEGIRVESADRARRVLVE